MSRFLTFFCFTFYTFFFLPLWELHASPSPGSRRVCWQIVYAPGGQWAARFAASCHARFRPQPSTCRKRTQDVVSLTEVSRFCRFKHKKRFCGACSFFVLTFICSLKVKYLPETLRPPISSSNICSRLRLLGVRPSASKSSSYCSEIAANVSPICLWKSSTAYTPEEINHLD